MTTAGKRIMRLLSPRQLTACKLVSAGKSNQEIADELDTTPLAVKDLLSYSFKKTGVGTRLGLAIEFFRQGVVECPCGANKKDVDSRVA